MRERFDPRFHCCVVEWPLASPGRGGEIPTRASTARTSAPVTKHSSAVSRKVGIKGIDFHLILQIKSLSKPGRKEENKKKKKTS